MKTHENQRLKENFQTSGIVRIPKVEGIETIIQIPFVTVDTKVEIEPKETKSNNYIKIIWSKM